MNFHLSFPVIPFKEKINYSHKLLFVGSCFAENIGEMMQKHKFNTMINPNGILYNPLSIANSLINVISNKQIKESELFFANECWNHWQFHSKFSNPNKNECLTTLNHRIANAADFLKQSDWLFITLGSAFVYKQNSTGELVANCHKLPQKEFTKHLLTIDEIVEKIRALLIQLNVFNPNLKVVFTISPVRYVRDGVVENNRSKARLIEAVYQVINASMNAFYFPVYELVIDDLRDYRFFKPDLVHPNEQAIEYVFEKLKNTSFDEESKLLFEKIKKIVVASSHRAFQDATIAHKIFKENNLHQCKELLIDYPFLNFDDELNVFGA